VYEPLSLATSLLGSGFGGRLFKSLRETYSFTYTPGAFLTQGKYMNRFVAVADVRNAVTDSAIIVLRKEIEDVTKEPAKESELESIKANMLGEYLMTYENKTLHILVYRWIIWPRFLNG
jgi:predicted Zn-dependent peptidase